MGTRPTCTRLEPECAVQVSLPNVVARPWIQHWSGLSTDHVVVRYCGRLMTSKARGTQFKQREAPTELKMGPTSTTTKGTRARPRHAREHGTKGTNARRTRPHPHAVPNPNALLLFGSTVLAMSDFVFLFRGAQWRVKRRCIATAYLAIIACPTLKGGVPQRQAWANLLMRPTKSSPR